jgi:hypothetical protein
VNKDIGVSKFIKVECPHCQVRNSVHVSRLWHQEHYVKCDVDEGGCDAELRIETDVMVKVEVYSVATEHEYSTVV